MNHYQLTRIADLRLQETARQARTAWWRSQPAADETRRPAPPRRAYTGSSRCSTRIAGA